MISQKHKCIFIHVPKVAGQSVEQFFVEDEGLTWSEREVLLLGRNDNPAMGPPRLAHLTATGYVQYGYIDEVTFNAYFKFAFVRDPWMRVFSLYKHLRYYPKISFEKFVREELPGTLWETKYWFVRPQADFVCNADGELIVDFLGRFENLQEDFATAMSWIGIQNASLPHANKYGSRSFRERIRKVVGKPVENLRKLNNTDKQNAFANETVQDIVRELYKDDFDLFEYNPTPGMTHQTHNRK